MSTKALPGVRLRARHMALGAATRRGYDPTKTVLVLGSARSGTTWLAELIAHIATAPVVFEPDHNQRTDRGRRASERNEWWHLDEQGLNMYRDLVGGRWLPERSVSRVPTRTLLTSRRLIVKAILALPVADQVMAGTDVGLVLVVARDPLDVVASRLRLGWTGPEPVSLVRSDVRAARPELMEVAESVRTPAERQAFAWAMDHLRAPAFAPQGRCQLIDYHALRNDPISVLAGAAQRLGLRLPADLVERAGTPSRTFDLSVHGTSMSMTARDVRAATQILSEVRPDLTAFGLQ